MKTAKIIRKEKGFKHILFTLLLYCAASQFLYAQGSDHKFNLDDFVARVNQANLQLKISKAEKDFEQKATNEAVASLLPQVNFQGGYQRNFNEQYVYFEFPDFSNIDPETGEAPVKMQKFAAGFKNDFQANFLLQQNLLSFKTLYELKSSRIYSDIEGLKYENKAKEIINNAKKMFLQTVLMEHVYELNRLTEKNAKENYLAAKNKYENKLISEMDFLQAKVHWENQIPQAKQAKRNYLILLCNLKIIAGLNAADSIVLENQYLFKNESFQVPSIDAVLEKREDYQMAIKNIDFQKISVKKEKSEFLPVVTGQLGYSYMSNSDKWKFNENENKPFYVGLTLTIPICSGGYQATQVQKAKIRQHISEMQREDAEQQIRIEISNLQMKLQEEVEIVKSAESTLNTARKGYELAQKNAGSGLISQLDLRKYSEDLKKAQLNFYYAIYNYECSKIDYNKALGNNK